MPSQVSDSAPTPHSEIVIVEPDSETASLIRDTLAEEGYEVSVVSHGEDLLALLRHHHPDLIILALLLPGLKGLDVLKKVQQTGRVPTIIVSQRGSEADRVVGLEMGADDYLAKPFSPRELLARVRALLRRVRTVPEIHRLEYDGFLVDFDTRDVIVDSVPVPLTALEFELLAFLAASPRQVFSRETLLDRVWGSSAEWQTTSTVSEHIHRLRRKIEPDAAHPQRIETVRGVGYRFTP